MQSHVVSNICLKFQHEIDNGLLDTVEIEKNYVEFIRILAQFLVRLENFAEAKSKFNFFD